MEKLFNIFLGTNIRLIHIIFAKVGILLVVICFVNQKGGVGKTTSVINIGAGLAKLNQRVLLIDLDPQESLTYWLGINCPAKTICDILEEGEALEDCTINHDGGFDVIASNEMLAAYTPDIYQIKQALANQQYDFVLLDCSPTLGMITLSALTAANWVIIPLCPDLLSIKGMSQLLGTIETIKEETNPNLILKSIIATRFCEHKRMHRDVLEQIQDFFKNTAIFTIRENIVVAESPVQGKSVLDYKPKSAPAKDYFAIARRLLHG